MERAYGALKQMLRDGVFAPGARLEANRIADQLGISMTPVRDVLYRLVGERLVTSTSGEGFHVPRFSESELRDLYEWHSVLISMALRTARRVAASAELDPPNNPADETAQVFEHIAAHAPNREVRVAIGEAGDRLHPYRMVEAAVLEPVIGELEALTIRGSGQLQAVRRYHLRRMRAVPQLLQHRGELRPTPAIIIGL